MDVVAIRFIDQIDTPTPCYALPRMEMLMTLLYSFPALDLLS